jgi:hypothetical protein
MSSSHHHSGRHHHHDGGECDTTGRHGMLLFGVRPLYLSHFAMYDCPHNFQVLLEVELDEATNRTLQADRTATGADLYTVDPDVFPIAELNPHGGGPTRTSLTATLVRGHFERGGTPIAGDVPITVRRVVHFAELDVDARTRVGQELRYLCFGRAGQLYLVHELKARPSFDQVLSARFGPGTVRTQTGHALDEDVTLFHFDEAQRVGVGRDDLVDQRLAVGETVTGWFDLTRSLTGSRGFTVQIEIQQQMFLEIAELA